MSESIADKTARTAFWGVVERVLYSGSQFVVTIILARLLTPDDYGIIAILTVFLAISQRIVECGFSNALIRKEKCTQADYSTAFFFNIAIGFCVYFILFIISSYVADFYTVPILANILRVYGLIIIIDSLRIVQYSILNRELQFKKLATISTIAVVLSGILGIIAAYLGFGAWALVLQALSNALIYVIVLTYESSWLPLITFSKESLAYLWKFGSKMLLTGIISSLYSNIYSLVIGKIYDRRTLGFFNRGQQLALFYPNLVQSVFTKNSLPILSQVQDNNSFVNVYRNFIVLVSFVTFPIAFLFFVLAKPIVILLLTEKWMGAIIYIQIFAITSFLIPANFINLNVFQAKGRSDITLKAELIKKTMGFILVFLLLPFGPVVMAMGCCVMDLLSYMVNLYYAKKILKTSMLQQLMDILPCFLSSFTMAVLTYCLLYMLNFAPIIQIIVCVIFGLSVYLIIAKYVLHLNILEQIICYLKNRI